MLSPEERDQLRRRATAAWGNARRLTGAARGLALSAQQIRGDAGVLRGLHDSALHRVDRIVEQGPESPDPARGGVGLVVASRLPRMSALHDALHERVAQVWTARDPALAVGLAIVSQPDVALIDDDLPIMSGLETAVLLRTYAPGSALLLFTDDMEARRSAESDHVRTVPARFDIDSLVAEVDLLVA